MPGKPTAAEPARLAPEPTPARAAASFGFLAGAMWSIALGMALETPLPAPLWVVVFAPLAWVTLRWADGWQP